MKQVVIYDHNGWRVTSYGNGTSYTLANTKTGKSVGFQGDDAEIFRNDTMDSAGCWRDSCEARFADYSEVMD